MDKYFELQSKYKLGTTIRGIVIHCDEIDPNKKYLNGSIILNCESNVKGYLPYDYLLDDIADFNNNEIPEIGTELNLTVINWRDDGLTLSNKTNDRTQEATKFDEFYKLIESEFPLNEEKTGTVKEVKPFGIFVDFGYKYFGLIDIGHIKWNEGIQLPYDMKDWPKAGEKINCKISYYRFWDRQIGLGWIPNKKNDLQHNICDHN